MATQLKHTDIRPIPIAAGEAFRGLGPRPHVRVAFSAGPAMVAVRDALATNPDAHKTLDEIALAETPLRDLLDARNAIMARLNDDTMLTEHAQADLCGETSAIELAILNRTPASADEAVVKLITLAQVSAEGHEVEDIEAARQIVDAQRFFGTGYVHAVTLQQLPPSIRSAPPVVHGKAHVEWHAQHNRYLAAADELATYDRDVHTPTFATDANPTEGDAVQARYDDLVDAMFVEFDALMLMPAPGRGELTTKLALFRHHDGVHQGNASEIVDRLLADARQFAWDATPLDGSEFGRLIKAAASARSVSDAFYDATVDPAEERYHALKDTGDVRGAYEAKIAYESADHAWDRMRRADYQARDAVCKCPVGTAADLRTKLAFIVAEDMGEMDFAKYLLADAERIVGQAGSATLADTALLDAFAVRRREYEANHGVDLTVDQGNAYFGRLEAHETALYASPALTIEGVVAKLRVAFLNQVGDAWSDLAISNPADPRFVDGLTNASVEVQRAWSAIEDLARIGGVDLAEQGL